MYKKTCNMKLFHIWYHGMIYLKILNKMVFLILSRILFFSVTSTSITISFADALTPFSDTVLCLTPVAPCDLCNSWHDWYCLTSYTALSVWQYRSSTDMEIFPLGGVVRFCLNSGANRCFSSSSSTLTSNSSCLNKLERL